MNIADIVAILIVIILIIWGIKKGFLRTVFGFGSVIISLVLALTLYPTVTDFLTESPVGEYVRQSVDKVFGAENTEAPEEPSVTTEKAKNLPQSLQETLTNTVQNAALGIKNSVSENVSSLALKLLSLLLVFVLVKILLWILLKVFNVIARLPVIRSLNKLLGGVVGACYGVLIIYLLLALLTFTTAIQAFNKPTQLVLESKYVQTMYHQNILLDFLK